MLTRPVIRSYCVFTLMHSADNNWALTGASSKLEPDNDDDDLCRPLYDWQVLEYLWNLSNIALHVLLGRRPCLFSTSVRDESCLAILASFCPHATLDVFGGQIWCAHDRCHSPSNVGPTEPRWMFLELSILIFIEKRNAKRRTATTMYKTTTSKQSYVLFCWAIAAVSPQTY